MDALRQPSHDRYPVGDQTDAGVLRRAMAGYADRLRVAHEGGRAELVATELATNLLYHAKPGGWVLARPVPPASVELIAVDRGPGIADVGAAVEGRTSAPAGLGRGLAAIRRASTHFDIHTRPGRGTTVLSVVELGPGGRPAPSPPRGWAGVSIGLGDACGDGWAVTGVDQGIAIAVVDGLGHGVRASAAADAALAAFADHPGDLAGYLVHANEAMRPTRGGAVAVCRLWPRRGELDYVAVGNINGRIWSPGEQKGLFSHPGTVGLHAAPPRSAVTTYRWPPDATLMLWSDGLVSRIDLAAEADLFSHDPAVVAATLHRDHARERDDATIVVVRPADLSLPPVVRPGDPVPRPGDLS